MSEGKRLQLLTRLGRYEEVLDQVEELRREMKKLPESGDREEGVAPWGVREVILSAGGEAALEMGRHEEALSLNTENVASKEARGATALDVAGSRFNDYFPLLRLRRHRDARAVLDFGAMISYTGVVTYKNAPEVRASVEMTPMDRIMAETDAPFLNPVPKRGVRPCEPAFAIHTARFLAQVKGADWDTFHAALDDNTERFFGVRARSEASA